MNATHELKKERTERRRWRQQETVTMKRGSFVPACLLHTPTVLIPWRQGGWEGGRRRGSRSADLVYVFCEHQSPLHVWLVGASSQPSPSMTHSLTEEKEQEKNRERERREGNKQNNSTLTMAGESHNWTIAWIDYTVNKDIYIQWEVIM